MNNKQFICLMGEKPLTRVTKNTMNKQKNKILLKNLNHLFYGPLLTIRFFSNLFINWHNSNPKHSFSLTIPLISKMILTKHLLKTGEIPKIL